MGPLAALGWRARISLAQGLVWNQGLRGAWLVFSCCIEDALIRQDGDHCGLSSGQCTGRAAVLDHPEGIAMWCINNRSLTIRLDEELEQGLEAACAETGRSRGEIVRDALRRQLQLMRFEHLRRRALPFGEAAGWLTDDDVFAAV